MIDPKTLDEIQARADAATKGPWEVANAPEEIGKWVRRRWIPEGDDRVHSQMIADRMLGRGGDAAFIAHAREDVPALVAEVRRLNAKYGQLLDALAQNRAPVARGWGTCAECPRDPNGRTYPDRCANTARYDHNLPWPVPPTA
jgi:hypothetical protein